ncbi:MAG: carboxypeptidase-like regulatory domain-containing protein [Terracidiphilus sp.]
MLILAGMACTFGIASIRCLAQTTPATYTVSGAVKNSLTGQPVPRALVNAQTDAVLTDSEGRFELRLQEGGAWLQVRRPGYSNGERRGGHMVRVGARMAALTLYLIPSASITGRLTGTNGGDVANISFTAYRRGTVNGHDRWLQAGAATTNGDGIFRMYDMAAPAAYVLCSRATPEHVGMQVQHSTIAGYPPVCYPANPGDGDANVLNLAVGQQADVDIPLSRQTFYEVGLVEQNASRGEGMAVEIHDQNGLPVAYSTRWDEQRRTIVAELPNGLYYADARSWGDNPAYGRADFKVFNAPLEGLSFTMVPLAPLAVEVREEFTGNHAPADAARDGVVTDASSGLNLFLNPVDAMDGGGGQPLEHPQGADRNHFVMKNVVPGRYWVQASYFLGGYISSITSGGVDLMRAPIVVGHGSSTEPMVVTLRNDGGEIDCTLSSLPNGAEDSSLLPAEESQTAIVYAIPSVSVNSPLPRAVASPRTTARIMNLAPGNYRVIALDASRNLDDADSKELATLAEQGKSVTVVAGGTVNVQVEPMISAGEGLNP